MMQQYRLQDLIDVDHFQELQDRLNEIYAFPSAVIDNEGNILTATAWQDICTQFHRKNKEAERLCIKSDQYIKDHFHEADPALTYRCPHGLVDNALPIIIDGIHYGNFFTGQFFLEEPDMEFFRAQGRKYGFDEDAYLKAVRKVPVWNPEQLNSYLLFIKGLITVIAETGLKKLKEIENRKRIQKTEETLATIFAMSLDMICIADINTATFVKVNPAFTETLGYAEEELLEKSFLDFIHPEDINKTRTVVEQKLQMGAKVINFENRYRCKDGSYRWLSWVSHPNTKKGVTFAVARDITELKRNEAALKKSKALLDAMGRMAKVGGWELDAETLTVTWTEETYRIHEVPLDQTPSLEGAINFFHPEDRKRLSQALQRALDDGDPYDMELRFITAKGNQLWTRTICQPETSNGKTVKLKGTFQDITKRKEAEASLKAIEWLLHKPVDQKAFPSPQDYGDLTALNRERVILDGVGRDVLNDIVSGFLELLETSAAVYEHNGDYAYGIFSSGWCRMLDSASRKLCDTPDDAEALASGKWLCHESCWRDASKPSIRTGAPVDVACSGGIRLYAVPIVANDEIIGVIDFGYGDPPKDRERIEEIALKYEVDPDDLQREANRYESRPNFIVEIAKKRLQGSARLIGALVESKMAQAELQKERERLNVTLQSIGDGVITTDVKGGVVLINKVAESLTGWRQVEAKGMKLDEVFHIINEQTRKPCENPVERVHETNGIIGLANNTVLVSRDGIERIIADSASPIVDDNGNTIGVVLVFRDITDTIELEGQLRQAHKMEAIGNLAGGIAHEFNNVLGIILGNAELAMDDVPDWNPAKESLREIRTASFRAKEVVRQILSFARKTMTALKPLEINTIVKESLKLMRASIPAMVDIRPDIPSESKMILGDPTEIHQIVINLCTNAAHAMKETGGVLEVAVSDVSLQKDDADSYEELLPGDFVKLTVKDSGEGIPPGILGNVFEPYFTTKEFGAGSGMGLAVVYGLVKKCRGAIKIDSTVGKGTTVEVLFPKIEQIEPAKEEREGEPPRGKERILLVDDDPSIVHMIRRMLERMGYTVLSMTDSTTALERFKSAPGDFDLVITDMSMPKMSGDQLAGELIKVRNGIPILLCTGHSDTIDEKKAKQIGIKGFAMKPLDTGKLARAVREILDKHHKA
jgi:PAS domain S-box-containing protein